MSGASGAGTRLGGAAPATGGFRPVRFGILGAAKIAREKIIPAMRAGTTCQVVAIASREHERAQATAAAFGIPRAYGSYEELLADPDVEAVYNPLPNHLHVPLSLRALAAGKHVLCEKPVAVSADEARELLAARDRAGRLVQEAAMVRTHPRWLGAREIVRSGRIGALRAIQGFFSYHDDSPDNVRNRSDIAGGGGLLDVGFYPVTLARFLFGAEPARVIGAWEVDPVFRVDRLASAILEFSGGAGGGGHATFTCGTQLHAHQALDIVGTRGLVRMDVPWSFPNDRPSSLVVEGAGEAATVEVVTFEACDQWGVMCDRFAQAIRAGTAAPVPLEDAVANMAVLDAIARSTRSGAWERPGQPVVGNRSS